VASIESQALAGRPSDPKLTHRNRMSRADADRLRPARRGDVLDRPSEQLQP
jgi:hypothetical protein